MSAETNELLAQQEPTAELYTYRYLGSDYRYTSHQKNLTDGSGNLYIAVPIRRTEFAIKTGAPKSTITVDMIYSGTIFESLRDINNMPITLTIKKCLISNIDSSYTVYTGSVRALSYERQIVTVWCDGGGYEIDRDIPTVKIQELCNNMLFDSKCSLERTVYELRARVTSISTIWSARLGIGGTIVLENYTNDSFGEGYTDKASGYYKNGYMLFNNNYVSIRDNMQIDSALWPLFPVPGLSVGDVVTLIPGCDKQASTCNNTFDNLTNFVGMPYSPSLNPSIWGVKRITT